MKIEIDIQKCDSGDLGCPYHDFNRETGAIYCDKSHELIGIRGSDGELYYANTCPSIKFNFRIIPKFCLFKSKFIREPCSWGTRDPCLICPIERGSMIKCDTCKSWSKNRRI